VTIAICNWLIIQTKVIIVHTSFGIPFLSFFILFTAYIPVSAQADTLPQMEKTFFGFGLGYGYVNPKQVNDKIQQYSDDQGNDFIQGNPEIHFVYIIGAYFSQFIGNSIELQGEFEFDLGLKEIQTMLYPSTYNFLTRLGYGGYGNYYFYVSKFNALYLGGGLNFNQLFLNAFDDSLKGSASPIGYSLQTGFSMMGRNGKLKKYFELQFNMVNGENRDYNAQSTKLQVNKISFSGVSFKVGYAFSLF
jgi:hypothetical protein